MAERAFITPEILKWARKSAKISEEIAASKASVVVERLREWEEGISHPTIIQAKDLAKTYRRPFALFFLPEIPGDFLPLQDFRKKGSKELGTASTFIIREIQQKQAWVREVNEENGEAIIPFVGRYTINNNPEVVAKNILETLNINPLFYERDNPILEWIDKAESKGIFISRSSFIHSKMKLNSNEMQGFAISDPYAPFVFVNSEDWDAPQLFTLVHELAHIWIAETGISNDIEQRIQVQNNSHPVEQFCNDVAAKALIPGEYINGLNKKVFTSYQSVFRASMNLGISSFAFLVRAFKLDIISLPEYQGLKQEADRGFQEFLAKEIERKDKAKVKKKPGGPSPYLLTLNKNSRLFTQVVIDAFRGGHVEPNLASSLLNTPSNNFHKLEAQLF